VIKRDREGKNKKGFKVILSAAIFIGPTLGGGAEGVGELRNKRELDTPGGGFHSRKRGKC